MKSLICGSLLKTKPKLSLGAKEQKKLNWRNCPNGGMSKEPRKRNFFKKRIMSLKSFCGGSYHEWPRVTVREVYGGKGMSAEVG